MQTDQWGMRIYSIDDFCKILYGTFRKVNTCLSFTFSTKPTATLTERLRQIWYFMMIASLGNVRVAVIVNENEEEIATGVIHNREDFKEFIKKYCDEHCKNFNGYLCVDTLGRTNTDVEDLDFDV